MTARSNASAGGNPRRSASPKRPFGERKGVLMTFKELGDYLGITEYRATRLTAEGELASVKVGGLVRVHINDVEAYIAKQRVQAGE